MTLCISAISSRDQAIVSVVDTMLSTEFASMDTKALKVMPACQSLRYMVAYAGSPSFAQEVALSAYRLIGANDEVHNVIAAFESAFRERLKRTIESDILSHYGVDRDTFRREGRQQFGDEEFVRILYKIEAAALGTDFLVSGFDQSGSPRLFSIHDPGRYEFHEAAGFYAIGTGGWNAVGSLYVTYDPWLSAAELAYRMIEAKCAGESASGVGERTVVMMLTADGRWRHLPLETIRAARVAVKESRPPVPPSVAVSIAQTWQPLQWQPEKKGKPK